MCLDCRHVWYTSYNAVYRSKRGCPNCGVKKAFENKTIKELTYFIDVLDRKVKATFTKEDFLSSTQKVRKKYCTFSDRWQSMWWQGRRESTRPAVDSSTAQDTQSEKRITESVCRCRQ